MLIITINNLSFNLLVAEKMKLFSDNFIKSFSIESQLKIYELISISDIFLK